LWCEQCRARLDLSAAWPWLAAAAGIDWRLGDAAEAPAFEDSAFDVVAVNSFDVLPGPFAARFRVWRVLSAARAAGGGRVRQLPHQGLLALAGYCGERRAVALRP
jgi:hypothetical protein